MAVHYQNVTNLPSSSNTRTQRLLVSDIEIQILNVLMSLIALLGTVSNSIVVFITKKESRYEGPIEEKRRRSMASYLIYNLSLSDLLASLFSCPSLIIQINVYSLQTKLGCSILRLVTYAFPTLSTQILAVVCLERYINLVLPFRNLRVEQTRRMIKCAWVSAAFFSLAISFTFKVNVIEARDDFYVFQCAHDLEDPTKKALYLISLFFTFKFPLIIICFLTIRSALVIRKFKCGSEPNPSASGLTERKVRSTWLVIWLVVIFGATCFPFVVYQGIKSIKGQFVGYKTDFIIRCSSAILIFSNAVINPFMYYKNLKSIRKKVNGLFRRSSPLKPNRVNVCSITFENVTYKPESLLQVPKVSLFEGRADEEQGTSAESGLNFSSKTLMTTEEDRNFSHVQLSVLTCPQQTVLIDCD